MLFIEKKMKQLQMKPNHMPSRQDINLFASRCTPLIMRHQQAFVRCIVDKKKQKDTKK